MGEDAVQKCQFNFSSGMGGSSSMPYHFTHDLFQNIPRQKYVKTDQYKQRYRPL